MTTTIGVLTLPNFAPGRPGPTARRVDLLRLGLHLRVSVLAASNFAQEQARCTASGAEGAAARGQAVGGLLAGPRAQWGHRRAGKRQAAAVSPRVLAAAADAPISAIIVGGSSGMGKAAAKEVVRRGGRALIVSRSSEKLERAREEILAEAAGAGGEVEVGVLDNIDEAAVEAFMSTIPAGSYDALVVSAADKAVHGPFLTLETSEVRKLVESKFWGAYHCAKYAAAGALKDGGSITFFSGVLNRRPGLNCSPLAVTNGAIEGLSRALALELGPRLRVNTFSPGFHDTERFDKMDDAKKEAMLANTAASLPLKRVGQPEDAGEALYFLMTNRFTTGITLDCDGGHQIRQYVDASTDPFRRG